MGFSAAEGVALAETLQRGGWSLRYLTEPMVQTADAGSLTGLVQRSRRKLRATAPMLTTLWLLLISTNMLLLGWAAFGTNFKLAFFMLALRYAIGLVVIAMSCAQYRRYPVMPSLLLFEPMLTFVGFCAYLSLLVKPKWSWGGVDYNRTGPEGEGVSPS